jgi:mRNA interferase HigB
VGSLKKRRSIPTLRQRCTSLEALRKSHPATDVVGDDLAIFNIRGNNYRLIVRMVWKYKRIYVKEFLTHAEYDRGRWKKWL